MLTIAYICITNLVNVESINRKALKQYLKVDVCFNKIFREYTVYSLQSVNY